MGLVGLDLVLGGQALAVVGREGHELVHDGRRCGLGVVLGGHGDQADEEEAGRGELGAGVQNVLARKENDEIAKKEKKQKRNNFDF